MVAQSRLFRVFLLVLPFALLGCDSSKSTLKVALQVDANVNPTVRGEPRPVVLRLYELKSLAAFNRSDFFSLFERERETLGADLLTSEEFQLQPDQQREFDRVLHQDTRYVGVVAAFRDLERARWRSSVPVPEGSTLPVTVRLEGVNVSVTTGR